MTNCRVCGQPCQHEFCGDACYVEYQEVMEGLADLDQPDPSRDFDMREPDGSYAKAEDRYAPIDDLGVDPLSPW